MPEPEMTRGSADARPRIVKAINWLTSNGYKVAIYVNAERTVLRVWRDSQGSNERPVAEVEGREGTGVSEAVLDAAKVIKKMQEAEVLE